MAFDMTSAMVSSAPERTCALHRTGTGIVPSPGEATILETIDPDQSCVLPKDGMMHDMVGGLWPAPGFADTEWMPRIILYDDVKRRGRCRQSTGRGNGKRNKLEGRKKPNDI